MKHAVCSHSCHSPFCCTIMGCSNSSGSSSSRSLRSHGVINPIDFKASMSLTDAPKLKAVWDPPHVKEMLSFLIGRLPEMGEGDFKPQVWNQLANHLRKKFSLAAGKGERTADACKSKFGCVCPILPFPHTWY